MYYFKRIGANDRDLKGLLPRSGFVQQRKCSMSTGRILRKAKFLGTSKQKTMRAEEMKTKTKKGIKRQMKKTDKNQEWFREWANEYDETLGKVKRHHKLLDLAVRLSEIKNGDNVLDIGCGTGLLSLKFLNKRNCTIKAIDSSAQMLKVFKGKIQNLELSDKIECSQSSAEKMKFRANQFDIIAATVALHHVRDKEPVIKTIHKALKVDGRFVLGEIDMDTTGKLEDTKRLLRILDYLKEEFALAMTEGGLQAFERMYENGKKHIMNDGEFCISFKKWAEICKKAGFKKVEITPLQEFEWFKVLVATK